MINLYGYRLLAVGLVGSAAILLVTELGWQLGVRGDGRGGSNIATLESAILGLLALIIGFTFAMALSRFEARRDAL
jgi:Zn-dependent protease with chaperone function